MSDNFSKIYQFFIYIKKLGMLVSGFAVFIMMFYICLDVLFRNIEGSISLYAYEITSNYFMPLIVFPAMAFAFEKGMMPRIDFIIGKSKNIKFQLFVSICLIILEIVLMLLLIFYGFQYFLTSVDSGLAFTAGGTNYPLWPVILLVPISFSLVLIEMVFLLIKNIASKKPSFVVIEDKK
ncbi:TRAP transporter small permease [Oceanobacillus halophilus]|uniref:TRAP transporter small permease subunit n=1 Tax=Oceanobacillus halophilus TaxID=930130 RepID=A0A495A7K4_9BACI|nr:TRAP transporter small permease subunit [Oceanobacillus halophilus]RKQ35772.1 TRAP transporter small permease subunit [Oceanobacillus halophilus]